MAGVAYFERDLTQFMRLDTCLIGGLTEPMNVAALIRRSDGA